MTELTENLRDEAIIKVDETPEERVCGYCKIVSARCSGGCCEGCDCVDT